MKTKLLLCLLAALAPARSANYVGDQVVSGPFSAPDSINIVGNLTLAAPGTYSAAAWNIVGLVRFGAPGDYTLRATTGAIAIAGNLGGPTAGTVTLRVSYRSSLNLLGQRAGNVMLIDETPPPGRGDVAMDAPLLNLSTRATLAPGGAVQVGFTVGGTEPRRVLVRAVGPGLAAFGVADPLADPALAVFSGASTAGANDDWGGGRALSDAFARAGAFALAPAGKDAALLLTLSPGSHTLVIRGVTHVDRGEVLAEVYLME